MFIFQDFSFLDFDLAGSCFFWLLRVLVLRCGRDVARFILFNYLLLFCKTSIQIFSSFKWLFLNHFSRLAFNPACVRVHPSKTKKLNKTLFFGKFGLQALKILYARV